eukprot:403364180
MFTENFGEYFTKAKAEFDQKINTSKFATIVRQQNFYKNEIIEKIKETTQQMDDIYDNLKDHSSRLIQVQYNPQNLIANKFVEILKDTFIIDASMNEIDQNKESLQIPLNYDQLDQLNQQQDEINNLNLMRNYSENSEMSNFSLMSSSNNQSALQWSNQKDLCGESQNIYSLQSFILRIFNSSSNYWENVYKGDLYYQRFISIPGSKDVYLIGGSRDFESDQTLNDVFLIRSNELIFQRKSMTYKKSKVCLTIGSVKSTEVQQSQKQFIFAIGGQESKTRLSKTVERYNPRADIWQQMPSLCQPRSEASAVVLDEHLYVFGGITLIDGSQNLYASRSIERFNLKALTNSQIAQDMKRFIAIELKLPFDCINIGLFPLSQNECLVLGGFSEKNLNLKMKFSSYINQNNVSQEISLESLNETKLECPDFFQAQSYSIHPTHQYENQNYSMYDEENMIEKLEEQQKMKVVGTYYIHEIQLWGSYEIKSSEIK